MISIVLCTYNGMKYLEPLLDSLRRQTLPANEVLVFDDGSKDGTPEFIDAYIEKHALSGWRCARNPENLGWKRNFMRGMEAASGDLIFPCDQDDVWREDKLEKMSVCMQAHPEILLLACNYRVNACAGAQRLRKTRDSVERDDGALVFHAFHKGYLLVERPGCCFCARREILAYKRLTWFEGMPHDAFLYRTADALGAFAILNAQLVEFRRHAQNTSDRKSDSLESHREHMRYYARASEGLLALMKEAGAPEGRQNVVRRGRALSLKRLMMLEKKSALRYAALLFHIFAYPAPAQYLKDGAVLFGVSRFARKVRGFRLRR